MKKAKPLTLKARHEERKQQEALKQAYGIEGEKVVVVERKNKAVQVMRVVVWAFFLLLRILASAAVAVLAIIGLTSLLFPDIRAELIDTLLQTAYQVRQFIGL